MATSPKISKVAIFPAIGIARIGNAPEEYYLAPEVPGVPTHVPDGYKDAQGRIKKQVARFRIYALDEAGNVLKELTANDAKITWRVHAANRKSAWYKFNNALDLNGLGVPAEFRNKTISDRSQLVIDPGPRTITGKNVQGKEYHLTGGKFMGKEVPLGEIRTDHNGRLLFFGGDGNSASYDNEAAVTFANNEGWHDDVSDGPVRATVVVDGQTLEAEPAMVVTTPPNYGPGLYGVVTMYDVIYDLFNTKLRWIKAPEKPNFWEHIFPIFDRMNQTQWVNEGFFFLFGQNSPSDFTDPKLLNQLADPSDASKKTREYYFNWVRDPESDQRQPAKVPPFYGDGFSEYVGVMKDNLPVTPTQYTWLKHWKNGNFSTHKPPHYENFKNIPLEKQPHALTEAALEDCLGGPFHPGIEITWPMRVGSMWKSAFRLNILPENVEPEDNFGPLLAPAIAMAKGGPLDASGPGTLSRWLGVPWQTDEASCLSGYDPSTYLPLPSFWAARVPNQVLSEDSFKRLTDPDLNLAQRLKHFDYRQDWLRDFGTIYKKRINSMVAKWYELGIIMKHETTEDQGEFLPKTLWVETDRGPFIDDDPSFDQVKYAEKAKEEQVEVTTRALMKRAGIKKEQRTKRSRPLFDRGER